jgi:large subunit ribosomal protein L9
MEVILIKDLKRKGTFGDIIEVADGYARNYLIPNGFALIANNSNKKRFEEMKDKALAQVSELRAELKKTADEIKGKTFTMTALSRDGKLYGSITPSVIVNDMIREDLPDLKINASDVIIDEGNIKFVGTYACKAQFTKDISASFTINIESDESDEQPELLEAILEDNDKNTSDKTQGDVNNTSSEADETTKPANDCPEDIESTDISEEGDDEISENLAPAE